MGDQGCLIMDDNNKTFSRGKMDDTI